jgi:hypothetical protein
VTVQVCGNAARRGSQDCDNISARSVPVSDGRSVQFIYTVSTPPVGCPCVLRASTSNSDVVRAAPIDVIGVPSGVQLEPVGGPADASLVSVRAKVADQDLHWPESWYPRFGADAKKDLVVTIVNASDAPVIGLRVVGQVGRKRGSGEPLAKAVGGAVLPGESRRVVVPFDVSAPVWGEYVVSGTVYGAASPIPFRTETSNDPWGLEVAVIVFVLVLVMLARRRERRAKREAANASILWVPAAPSMVGSTAHPAPTSNQDGADQVIDLTVHEAPIVAHAGATNGGPQSSPDVGSSYGRRCASDFYDQPRDGIDTELDRSGSTTHDGGRTPVV